MPEVLNQVRASQSPRFRVRARWWEPAGKNKVKCILCPRYCRIPDHSRGFCSSRENHAGVLYTTAYGFTSGLSPDPIEKKPLYHFYPGNRILSFGTRGCNLGCQYCQNWHLSKSNAAVRRNHWIHPVDLIKEVKRLGCIGLAYTYNEPIIFSEWVQTVAEEAQRHGLKNVLVTNGYVTPEAREAVFQHIDAVNVDLKGIREIFYRKKTLAHLDPVLDTLRWLVLQKRIWIEITNLVIPGVNDSRGDLDKLTQFIASELKRWIPLHFTAFHPDYKMLQVPATPLRILQQARRIAIRNGLQFVYLGNVTHPQGQSTLCPHCRQVLIQRNYYSTRIWGMNSNQCGNCGKTIPGRFQWNGACS